MLSKVVVGCRFGHLIIDVNSCYFVYKDISMFVNSYFKRVIVRINARQGTIIVVTNVVL
jgi:hypothetical protein